MKHFTILFMTLILAACGDKWTCTTSGTNIYSVNSSGEIGSASKGCSCEQIREFELRTFGKVDEQALKSDFGCY